MKQDQDSRLPLVLFLVGGAVTLVGDFFSIAWLMKTGFICISLAIIAAGIEMLVTGRATFSAWSGYSWGHYERFAGLPARGWGILFLVFGGFVGLVTLVGTETFWAWLLGTPRGVGVFLFGIGASAIIYGIIRIIAGTALSGSGLGASVSNFLARLWGVLILLIGLGFVLFGLVLVVAPDVLLTPIHRVLQNVPTPPIPPVR
jgi:hypothetical protein